MKFARGTPWRFILSQLGAAAALLAVGGVLLAAGGGRPLSGASLFFLALGSLACGWVALLVLFFRDPERRAGEGVVAPADGKVRAADQPGRGAIVSIFLRIQDVHVVRAPIAGRVSSLAHRPGGKRFAFSKDSHLNERLLLSIAGEGESCSLTLIAGAFADRIEPYVEAGAAVEKGARIGIIKFGSRVDVDYTSKHPTALCVKPGSTVIAGETTILLPEQEAAPG